MRGARPRGRARLLRGPWRPIRLRCDAGPLRVPAAWLCGAHASLTERLALAATSSHADPATHAAPGAPRAAPYAFDKLGFAAHAMYGPDSAAPRPGDGATRGAGHDHAPAGTGDGSALASKVPAEHVRAHCPRDDGAAAVRGPGAGDPPSSQHPPLDPPAAPDRAAASRTNSSGDTTETGSQSAASGPVAGSNAAASNRLFSGRVDPAAGAGPGTSTALGARWGTAQQSVTPIHAAAATAWPQGTVSDADMASPTGSAHAAASDADEGDAAPVSKPADTEKRATGLRGAAARFADAASEAGAAVGSAAYQPTAGSSARRARVSLPMLRTQLSTEPAKTRDDATWKQAELMTAEAMAAGFATSTRADGSAAAPTPQSAANGMFAGTRGGGGAVAERDTAGDSPSVQSPLHAQQRQYQRQYQQHRMQQQQQHHYMQYKLYMQRLQQQQRQQQPQQQPQPQQQSPPQQSPPPQQQLLLQQQQYPPAMPPAMAMRHSMGPPPYPGTPSEAAAAAAAMGTPVAGSVPPYSPYFCPPGAGWPPFMGAPWTPGAGGSPMARADTSPRHATSGGVGPYPPDGGGMPYGAPQNGAGYPPHPMAAAVAALSPSHYMHPGMASPTAGAAGAAPRWWLGPASGPFPLRPGAAPGPAATPEVSATRKRTRAKAASPPGDWASDSPQDDGGEDGDDDWVMGDDGADLPPRGRRRAARRRGVDGARYGAGADGDMGDSSPHGGFACTTGGCGKRFRTRRDLRRHQRVHLKMSERPYKCSMAGCAKAFLYPNDLRRHMLTHTGERPHCCPVPGCGKHFRQRSHVATHLHTHRDHPFVLTHRDIHTLY